MNQNLGTQFLSMVNPATARGVRRGSVEGSRAAGASPLSFESDRFGSDNPLRNPAIHWDADSRSISVRDSDSMFPEEAEHDPEAPVSVVHGRAGSTVRINNPGAITVRGVSLPRHQESMRGWEPAAHGTTPQAAEAVADLVRSGRHGVLMSEHGVAGPGTYAWSQMTGDPARHARASYTNGGALIEGVMRPDRGAFDSQDPVVMAALRRTHQAPLDVPAQKHNREVMLHRGIGHVPDDDGGVALLHPSQFRVTAVHTPSGTQTFDPAEQSFHPGDPLWSPRTVGR